MIGTRAASNSAAGRSVTFVHSQFGPIELRLKGSLANFEQKAGSRLRPQITSYRTRRGTVIPVDAVR